MFDALLHREIKSGREFEGLFPPSLQTKTKLGTGDTSLTIELMIDMIQKTLGQTKKVAKKLQKSSLKETIKSVHQFLYWHFQYKADGTAQMLHSPSRSWENRHIGIDCKSYTILASSILSNLGIKHSIRKIKQPAFNPNQFTHVYVYVPAENMIIDGTILENKEPAFVEKKDFAMSLPHYGLNGVAKQSYWIDPKGRVRSFHSNTGLNGGLFETVKNLFNGVKCWGGSAFDQNALNKQIDLTTLMFNEIIANLNNHASSNNVQAYAQEATKFVALIKGFHDAFIAGSKHTWSNPCTGTRIKQAADHVGWYRNKVLPVFERFLQQVFNVQSGQPIEYVMHEIAVQRKFTLNIAWKHTEPRFVLQPKKSFIPAFQITEQFQGVNNTTDANNVVMNLLTLASYFAPTPNSGGGSYTIDPPTAGNLNPNNGNNNSMLGTSLLFGGTLLGAAYLFFNSNNNPQTPKKNVSSTRK